MGVGGHVDFDQYVAARYGRLIEHAVLMGCADGEAGAYVDQVLLDNKKQIRRSDDPDPLVRDALERAIEGRRPRDRRTGPFVAIAVVGLAVVVAVALTYRPPPKPVPSLFGLDGRSAEQLLEAEGYDVQLRPSRACEPPGLVLGSSPRPGELAQEGSTVTVLTAATAGSNCEVHFLARSAAWRFVRFALGGEAPEFADTVHVITDRSEPATLTRAQAEDGARWGGTFELIDEITHRATRTPNRMPTLSVTSGEPPDEWCGVLRPVEAGERSALRVTIETRWGESTDHGCPLTIDLYRYEDQIDSVVVYTPKGDPIRPAGRLRNVEPQVEAGQPQ